MNTRGARRDAGFTLIELLIVTALLAVVIAVVGACLGGGIRVWDAARTFGRSEQDGLIAMETLCKDLRNAFPLQAIGFAGTPNTVAFPGVITTINREDGFRQELGRVRYRINGEALVRETEVYPEGAKDSEGMVGNVVDLQFVYRADAESTMEGTTNLPRWVDVTLVLRDGEDGEEYTELKRTMAIASGGAP